MPKALKSCPMRNKSPNMVTLINMQSCYCQFIFYLSDWWHQRIVDSSTASILPSCRPVFISHADRIPHVRFCLWNVIKLWKLAIVGWIMFIWEIYQVENSLRKTQTIHIAMIYGKIFAPPSAIKSKKQVRKNV